MGLGFLLRLLRQHPSTSYKGFFFFNLKDLWGIHPDLPEA